MALAIGPPFGRRWFALSHRTVPPYRPVDELPSPSHSPCPRTLDRSLGPFASPVLCSMGELIQVSPDSLPHPSFWFTCSGAPGGAQYTLLQPQDLDPALHPESGFTDGSDVLFSLYNQKAGEYDRNLAMNWREDAQGIMLLVSYA